MTSEEMFDEISNHGAVIQGNLTAPTGNLYELATHNIIKVELGNDETFTGSNENGPWEFFLT